MQMTDSVFSVAGKVVFITGSTTGIGRALAEGFIAAGAEVWGHGPNPAQLDGLDHTLSGRVVTADFTQPEEIDAMAAALRQKLSRLDVLINNAGIEIIMPLARWDMAILEKTMQVNVFAPTQLTHLLLPLLKESSGASIINLTSIHATVPYPHNAAYSMSKAALDMFTKTMSLELAPFKIRINNLAPGAVETNINREVLARIGHDKFAEWIPLGRVAQAAEMIPPAIFLASAASIYTTGTTLYSEGGYIHNLVRYRP
jgi:NAD(P)-dependent dehydrogenase (short-subunit alcohol dehydrogenase family)